MDIKIGYHNDNVDIDNIAILSLDLTGFVCLQCSLHDNTGNREDTGYSR